MLPTDWTNKRVKIPEQLVKGGDFVHMQPRKADSRNIRYLKEEGIVVVETPEKLLKELKARC